MFYYYKVLDVNLVWLTQKAEESKCNKKKLLFLPTHAVNATEL